jgi:hypothetical protein
MVLFAGNKPVHPPALLMLCNNSFSIHECISFAADMGAGDVVQDGEGGERILMFA